MERPGSTHRRPGFRRLECRTQRLVGVMSVSARGVKPCVWAVYLGGCRVDFVSGAVGGVGRYEHPRHQSGCGDDLQLFLVSPWSSTLSTYGSKSIESCRSKDSFALWCNTGGARSLSAMH